MKKILALLLAVCMVLAMAACAAKQPAAEPTPAAEPATQPETTEPAEPAQEQSAQEEHAPVTITWIHQYNEDGLVKWLEWLKEAVAEKYPYITLDTQVYSADEIDSILMTKIASDDAPQIFACRPAALPEYIDAGYVYDLSGQSWLGNVADSFVGAGVVNGV